MKKPEDGAWSRGVGAAAVALMISGCSLSPATSSAQPETPTATVLRIVDGDTVDVVDDHRGRLRVRLLGIDTPETKKPGYGVACWGPEATAFATKSLLGQRVAVVEDPSQGVHDRYGRTLAYLVKVDGWDYSTEAARSGAAHAYIYGDTPVSRADQIAAAERRARVEQRGLWGPPCFGDTEAPKLG